MNVCDSKRLGRSFLGLGDGEVDQIKTVLLWNLKRLCIKAVAVVMLLPAAIEAAPAPKEVAPELRNGCPVLDVGRQKQVLGGNDHATAGFKSGELVVEGGAESGRCGGKSVVALNAQQNKPANQGGKDSWMSKEFNHDDWWGVLIVLIMYIVGHQILYQKPNARDQRPRNSGRKPAVKRSAASDGWASCGPTYFQTTSTPPKKTAIPAAKNDNTETHIHAMLHRQTQGSRSDFPKMRQGSG